jgi:hypothetical protein
MAVTGHLRSTAAGTAVGLDPLMGCDQEVEHGVTEELQALELTSPAVAHCAHQTFVGEQSYGIGDQ